MYKNRVRKNIRNWVDTIQSKKNQEWLIVYVANAEAKRSNNYLGLKSSVYDKIRTDFNPPKQDRYAIKKKAEIICTLLINTKGALIFAKMTMMDLNRNCGQHLWKR